MVRCDICGQILLERPSRKCSQLQPDGFWESLYEIGCPWCGSVHFSEADSEEKIGICPVCGLDVQLDDEFDWQDDEPVHENCEETTSI